MPKTIPTYSADGRKQRRYTLEAIERLLSLNLVAVERNRKGAITVAMFRPLSGANPIQTTAHMGTAYSFEEMLPSGHSAWRHRELTRDQRSLEALFGEAPDDLVEAELFIRAIFRSVPLSCMAKPKAPAKVVSIDAGRRPKPARPVEFDSEDRNRRLQGIAATNPTGRSRCA